MGVITSFGELSLISSGELSFSSSPKNEAGTVLAIHPASLASNHRFHSTVTGNQPTPHPPMPFPPFTLQVPVQKASRSSKHVLLDIISCQSTYRQETLLAPLSARAMGLPQMLRRSSMLNSFRNVPWEFLQVPSITHHIAPFDEVLLLLLASAKTAARLLAQPA